MSVLIEVEKEGMHLNVHPDTLEAHKRVGWKVVEKPSKPVKAEKAATVDQVEKPETADQAEKPETVDPAEKPETAKKK